jgi:preprotein translocase subunit SecB
MQFMFEDMLFPVLEMSVNTKHDPKSERAGTQLLVNHQLTKLGGGDSRYGLAMAVGSDNQNSVNPPYKFLVEVYAIIIVKDSNLDPEAEGRQVVANGMSILMGSARERIAELTARAPWGRFLINPTLLTEPVQISYI